MCELYDESDEQYDEFIYNEFDEILQREIAKDVFSFSCMTKIVGLSFNTTKDFILENINSGDYLNIERERENKYDVNALAVYCKGTKIGYISKNLASQLTNYNYFGFRVSEITGVSLGTNNVGINGKLVTNI